MSMEQDTGALPRRSARIAVRARPAVPPRPKRFSRRTTPTASSTALTVQDTTGDLLACPVREASEPWADYRGWLQAFTDAVAAAEAQQAAAEAERQRLAKETAVEAQRTAETDEEARNRRNVASTESLIASEHQWTTLLQGMIFVPTETQAEPAQAEAERSNLATVMLNVMRGVMWNNKLLQAHLHTERQQRHQYQQDLAAVTAGVRDAAMQQQQQQQLMNSTIARINGIEAKASAAPGCTTDATKQINERIDHVVTIIGDIGVFNGPDTISSTVAAIKTDITKLQTRPDAATKMFTMPHFDICKFDDYNKSDALTWWQRFLTEASCRTVPANDMLKALYLQLIGGAQAWMNHLAATHKCTIAELHTHITWQEYESLGFTRFMVHNVVKAAMNEVYTCSQGNMPTQDWTTKWQKIVTTPGFDLTFPNQRSEFFSRSCAGLRSALGNEYDYTTFQGILDRANLAADIDVPCSSASIRKYRDLLIKARANMQKAQIRMQQQANRRRLPCPFREGDLVWVLSEEFALEQDVLRKLLPKWFGPWEVISVVGDDPAGPSFVINIPPHLTVHRVFHASKLAIYTPPSADEFPGRRSQDPPSMDGHQEVDRVITHRKYGNKPRQFKVTFKQCAPDDTRQQAKAVQSHIQAMCA
uniref:Retrotransposon gag domain-containing protein n=1 Tax=Chara braunii TaxID=69332 RepID=A0A388LSF1_CHABU